MKRAADEEGSSRDDLRAQNKALAQEVKTLKCGEKARKLQIAAFEVLNEHVRLANIQEKKQLVKNFLLNATKRVDSDDIDYKLDIFAQHLNDMFGSDIFVFEPFRPRGNNIFIVDTPADVRWFRVLYTNGNCCEERAMTIARNHAEAMELFEWFRDDVLRKSWPALNMAVGNWDGKEVF
jgi:hypothetical protein